MDQISQGDTTSTSRQYPITDGLGNVRYLTTNSGTTVSSGTFAYDPYGKQTTGSTTASNYTFQTEQNDAESGLTYLRARYYDPTLGRFTSQDPLGGSLADPAGQNGYNYANDDPVNNSDPTGMFSMRDLANGVDAAYNAVIPKSGIPAVDNFIRTASGVTDIESNLSNCNWGGLAVTAATSAVPEGKALKGVAAVAKVAKVEKVVDAAKSGSYLLKFESGKTYDGKGLTSRMNDSVNRILKNFQDPLVSKTFTPANSEKEAFINEFKSLKANGGPKSPDTYNLIESPGKRLGGY